MKQIFYALISCFALLLCSTSLYSVVAVHKAEAQELNVDDLSDKAFKNLSVKKQKRLKKRLAKLKHKLEKKTSKQNRKPAIDLDIFQDSRFRLGAVVFIAGLALLLLSLLFIGFGGFMLWVARVATLLGLILMVWALIENA